MPVNYGLGLGYSYFLYTCLASISKVKEAMDAM